jgi:hypothetical protein
VAASQVHSWLNWGARSAAIEALDDEYQYYKIWVTVKDSKVRDPHRRMEGVRVPQDSKFLVDGHLMDGPGDTSAPLALWINCRCWLRYDRE